MASEKSGRLCGRTPTPSRGGRGSPALGQRRCWLPRSLLGSSGSAAPQGPSSPPPKKSRGCVIRESISSPSYPETGFPPQNSPGPWWDREGARGWAAFIANTCRGAEYLARRGLSEMPAVFKRDRQRLPASRAVMSGRDASHRGPLNPPANTHLYLISTHGVIYPVL